jgi:hypothetical protein
LREYYKRFHLTTYSSSAKRAGAEIAELYVGGKKSNGSSTDKGIEGFKKVFVQSGEKQSREFDRTAWAAQNRELCAPLQGQVGLWRSSLQEFPLLGQIR